MVACMMCHSLKDRHPISRWPLHLAVMAAVELAEHDADFEAALEWPSYWGDLTSHARIMWAKCAAVALDVADLADLDLITDRLTWINNGEPS